MTSQDSNLAYSSVFDITIDNTKLVEKIVFENPTDVIRIQPPAVSVQKALQNGQIVILREGKRYSILGTQL